METCLNSNRRKYIFGTNAVYRICKKHDFHFRWVAIALEWIELTDVTKGKNYPRQRVKGCQYAPILN